jgi:type I restriction enzyme S subunit
VRQVPSLRPRRCLRGDLTADWREQNPDVEPALVLLDRIQKEITTRRTKKEINELPEPFGLPDEWEWAKLSNVCGTITDGDHQIIPKVPEGIALLDITNIRTGKLDFSNVRYISNEYYQSLPNIKSLVKEDFYTQL